MYHKIALGAAAAALLMAGAAHAQTMVTATSDLNIRSGPGPHHPVVGVIAVDGQADLEGCLQASKWCRVSYNGTQGWAYSDYLIAEYSGRDMVVAQRPAEVEIPVVEYEDETGTGAAVGATGGAVAGAIIGGPIGAAVGGVAGANLGAATAIAIDPPQQTRSYILENEVEPVYLEGEVVIGAGVPEPVRLYEIPDYEYRYAYVNGQPVIVEPTDRRIVYIVR
ncbi:MAG: DUF1236 domain-containing protein [Rhizobiaceae bacterium]|nr:DUF1236 domain-containing protein [Rhizobiaceae bacterium]